MFWSLKSRRLEDHEERRLSMWFSSWHSSDLQCWVLDPDLVLYLNYHISKIVSSLILSCLFSILQDNYPPKNAWFKPYKDRSYHIQNAQEWKWRMDQTRFQILSALQPFILWLNLLLQLEEFLSFSSLHSVGLPFHFWWFLSLSYHLLPMCQVFKTFLKNFNWWDHHLILLV